MHIFLYNMIIYYLEYMYVKYEKQNIQIMYSLYIYIYIFIHLNILFFMFYIFLDLFNLTHTHTHIYIYIYNINPMKIFVQLVRWKIEENSDIQIICIQLE